MVTPNQAIETLNARFGRHPGYRAAHAKGTLCRARFTATPEAGRLTRASLMQGQPVDAIVRFSNSSGDPGSPDYSADIRGMATAFLPSDGARTDIVAQTSPRFPARTAEAFLDFLRANRPGPARLLRVGLFLLRHPEALPAVRSLGEATRPPVSYATCTYHALHAFRWIAEDGSERHVRYRWIPHDGVKALASQEARLRGPDYLQADLRQRLSRGRIRFSLEIQLAADTDPVDDLTAVWPAERQVVSAGVLEVMAVEAAPGPDSDDLAFNPTRTVDGIALPADAVLHFRPPVYTISAERRMLTGTHTDRVS